MELEDLGLTEEQRTAINEQFTKANEQIREINSKLKTEKEKEKERRKSLEDKYNSLEAQNRELQKYKESSGVDLEELKQKALNEAGAKYQDQLGKNAELIEKLSNESKLANAKLAEYQNKIVTMARTNGLDNAMRELNADPAYSRAVHILSRDVVMVDGKPKNIIDVDESGATIFRDMNTGNILSNEKGTFSYVDFINHLHEKDYLPVFKQSNSSNATKGGKMNTDLKKSQMSYEEKRKYKAEYGIKAYDALDY